MLVELTKLTAAVAGLLSAAAGAQAQPAEAPVYLRVLVPANARVLLDGVPTTSTGSDRTFKSPPVPVGQKYTYTIKVSLDGKTVTRDAQVTPGGETTLDLRPDFGVVERVAAYEPSGAAGQGQPPQDQQVVKSTVIKGAAATSVNFRKQFGLPYPSLTTLGARIDAARRAPDPVALAHTASELAVAESVSGKQASVSSSAILKESAELASLRRQVTELQAVQRVAQQVAGEQDLITNLRKQIDLAKENTRAEQQAFAQNQQPGWTPRKILVNNYTTQYLTIYVNGNYKGEVTPGGQQTFVVEHRWNPTVLKALGDQDIDSWGPVNVWGQYDTYTWNIN
jgi:uncharacterized protein (TIGR03000 family)